MSTADDYYYKKDKANRTNYYLVSNNSKIKKDLIPKNILPAIKEYVEPEEDELEEEEEGSDEEEEELVPIQTYVPKLFNQKRLGRDSSDEDEDEDEDDEDDETSSETDSDDEDDEEEEEDYEPAPPIIPVDSVFEFHPVPQIPAPVSRSALTQSTVLPAQQSSLQTQTLPMIQPLAPVNQGVSMDQLFSSLHLAPSSLLREAPEFGAIDQTKFDFNQLIQQREGETVNEYQVRRMATDKILGLGVDQKTSLVLGSMLTKKLLHGTVFTAGTEEILKNVMSRL